MSGGGDGQTQMETYQKDVHNIVLSGVAADGTTDWSDYLDLTEDYRDNPSVLRYILEQGITQAGGNPYDGVSSYDPEEEVDAMTTQLDSFLAEVAAWDPDGDWPDFLAVARTNQATDQSTLDVDSLVEQVLSAARRNTGNTVQQALEYAAQADRTDLVERALAAFEARARKEHLHGLSRYTATLARGGAVNGSAIFIGVALLEGEYADRLAAFDAEFTLPLTREVFQAFIAAYGDTARVHLESLVRSRLTEKELKDRYLFEGAGRMLEAYRTKTDFSQRATNLTVETRRIQALLQSEQYASDLDIDVKSEGWDMELFQQGANVLSAVHGSVVPNAGKPSRFQSAVGGAMGGAALGAQAGGGNPWAIGGGAIAGGIAGLFSNGG